ncbi:MarR family winged helix-turn-helix transcriptional regulator [Micromonospora sp. DT47]|uniref:MarR family winged helix-turn-helix transcriptional regulator n=1 Tax=Micromonospora sp. DT47 TaxID=3393431 RepID=UPI003CEA80AA
MNGIHNPATVTSAPDCRNFSDALERLFAFAVTVGDYMQAGLVARGLTRARATVVWQLHRHGPTTQRQLARTIGVTARNVTALVDGLEESGFVLRRPHPSDRRAILVQLTDTGRAVTEQLGADYAADSAQLFADLPPGGVQQFLAMLDTLMSRLTTVGQDRTVP